ncbi:MAG: hypothetical protein KAJ51_04180 [Thermoplasmata archaeon]|nr:hypothetical protein [Thermoplasmata archaeon]
MKKITIGALAVMVVVLMVLSVIPPVASDGDNTRSRGADILLVRDGGDYTTIQNVKTVLENAGYSTYYASSEGALPSGWDDPNNYPSIFWFGGTSYMSGMPSNTNAGKIVTYVQNGGNVLSTGAGVDSTHYPGSPGSNEINYLNWVTHHYVGNQWNGGMSGSSSSSYKTTRVTVSTHEIFNNPNVLPSSWTGDTSYYCIFWYYRSGPLNNGQLIAKASTSTLPRYGDIWAWDGPSYGPNYGRTVLVRHPIRHWLTTSPSGILSKFVENVAAWFGPGGISAEVVVDPQSINLESMGNFVQVKVEGFPDNPEYSPMDVDSASVAVGGVGVDLKYGTYNNNRFIGKADRLLVEDSIGAPGAEVEVDVSGKLKDGTGFMGIATIKAIQH